MNSISMSYHVRTEFTTVVTFGRYQIGSESNLQVLYNNLRFMNLKCHFIPSFININDHPTSLSHPLHSYMNIHTYNRCQMGYILQGNANLTCLASGNWSSPPPSCIPIQCPPLFLEDPHLSLIELNTSAWGNFFVAFPLFSSLLTFYLNFFSRDIF